MVNRTKHETDKCFNAALKTVVYAKLNVTNLDAILEIKRHLNLSKLGRRLAKRLTIIGDDGLTHIDIHYETLKQFQVEIDLLYLENIKKLSTKILEEIIFCHDEQKFTREQNTLEVIKQELANRGLLGDHS